MSETQDDISQAGESHSTLASGFTALGAALVVAGIISIAALLLVGQQDMGDPEVALERLVESRAAAYLADAADYLD